MKKLIALYHQSLFLKLLVFFISAIFIILLFSDFVLDEFVQNTVLWYKIQVYRWIIIPIFLTIIVYLILQRPFKLYKENIQNLQSVQKNYRFVVDSLIDDYFFYRHERDKPFIYLSSSITNVLGYTKIDFINNYQKYGAGELYKNVFEKHESYVQQNLKPPVYELVLKDARQKTCYLEIKEIPVFNEAGEIIAIEGTAKNITKYKTIEIELNEKEKKYQTIFEVISDGLLVIKDNKIIDCNKRVLEIFNCTVEELIMHTPFHYRFSPPYQPNGVSSRELAIKKIELAYNGQPQHFEWIHLRNGHDPFPAEISLVKFSFEGEDFVLAVVRDVSQKKTIIETLKEKEESFRILYESLPIGVMQLQSDGTILNINPKGLSILQITDEHEASFFVSKIKQRLGDLYPQHFTIELDNDNSHSRCLSVHVNRINLNSISLDLVLFEDITETIILKRSCTKQEAYFKEILENSRQILYKLNIETGSYEYISSALYNILGYTPEEFYQMSAEEIKSLLHPDDMPKANTIVAKLIQNLDTFNNEFIIEYRFKHKNGQYKWLSDKYQIISQDDSTYIVGNIMDITQIKDAEQRIQEFLEKK
ncbi:MAG: PAS domain S-box protein [Bacteroidales bacterium]|nr:PAS domain S-box protein [Bacteroidales bacterium]